MSRSYDERFGEAQSYWRRGNIRVATEPQPIGQMFRNGSFVMIAKDLGQSMSHFEKNIPAMVHHVYAHAYGGDDVKSYSLLIRKSEHYWHSVSWYHEHQLTQIEDAELISKFKKEISNLNGIK